MLNLTNNYKITDLGDISIAQYSHIISLKVAIDRFKKQQ